MYGAMPGSRVVIMDSTEYLVLSRTVLTTWLPATPWAATTAPTVSASRCTLHRFLTHLEKAPDSSAAAAAADVRSHSGIFPLLREGDGRRSS